MRTVTTRFALLVLLGGCAGQVSEMPNWVSFGEDSVEGENDYAVVVLRVEPAAEVLLSDGRAEQSGWRGSSSRRWLSCQDGYVVARVSPTHDQMAYGVVQVRPGQPVADEARANPDGGGLWAAAPTSAAPGKSGDGIAYGPAADASIPLFRAAMGRVSFVGTLRIEGVGERETGQAAQKVVIWPATSPDDLDAARRFVAQHYPKIRARVVASPLQMMKRSEAGR